MKKITTLALACFVLGSMIVAAPAHATVSAPPASSPTLDFTPEQIHEAVAEFQQAGIVQKQLVSSSGDLTSTVDLGRGVTLDLVEPSRKTSRLSAGRDNNGAYVQFNTIDQQAIIGGGGWAMTAGLCVLIGGPTLGIGCGVVTAIMIVVTAAVATNGGACSQNKQLRVWITNTGAKNPKCV